MTPHGQRGRWTDAVRGYLSRTTPVVPPIYQCTTFELDDDSYRDIVEGGGYEQTWYTRFGNPTVAWAADAVARLEGAAAGVMTSSGMAAIATTLLSLCRAGDRVVAARELYGDTRDLLVRDLPALGIRVEFVAAADLGQWRAALAAGPVAVACAESLSNPQLRVLDVPEVADLAHRSGARLVVDNTFASAFTVQPLALGADVVVHSATKFLNGHSDVVAGAVAGAVAADAGTVREVQRRVVTLGTCLDPHAAFLVARALHTYELRLARQAEGAARVARWLEGAHDDVAEVRYPGLASHPDAAVAGRTWRPGRRGAMVAFVVRGGNHRAARFLRALDLVREATSLGGVETLISAPHNSRSSPTALRSSTWPASGRAWCGSRSASSPSTTSSPTSTGPSPGRALRPGPERGAVSLQNRRFDPRCRGSLTTWQPDLGLRASAHPTTR